MTLDINYSHPILDSLWYKDSSLLVDCREAMLNYILQHLDYLGHELVLKSVLPYIFEPANNLQQYISIFCNRDLQNWSILASELKQHHLPRNSPDPWEIKKMQELTDYGSASNFLAQ